MLKITIEGPQGSGKSTAADIIVGAMTKEGFVIDWGVSKNGKETLVFVRARNPFAEARKAIGVMPPAISGSGGHAATFVVARKLVQDFALSDPDAWNLLLEYNKRCEPPWSEKELRYKLENARTAVAP